ncbi:Chemotaxis protein methyltransferase Cher2 [compost metagenome]
MLTDPRSAASAIATLAGSAAPGLIGRPGGGMSAAMPFPTRNEALPLTSSSPDYELFRAFLEKTCGIVLGANKQYLVSSRLSRLMEQEGIKSLGELVQRIQGFAGGALRERVVDAMTTNETLWFRDTYPFEVLKNRILPEMLKANPGQRLRIWSAACSSGQEPYSLSMAIDEFERSNLGQLRGGAQIVATDLSGSMLVQAKAGEYDNLAMGRGLSSERQQRYFEQKAPGRWALRPAIRSRVEFRALNLLDSYSLLGKFDMIFCRNVLIYFSVEAKRDILLRMHAALKPGGYLFLGASEALNGLPEHYQMVQCNPGIIYQAK